MCKIFDNQNMNLDSVIKLVQLKGLVLHLGFLGFSYIGYGEYIS